VLRAVSGKGRPVVTVFMAGRPLYVNDLLNRSDAFVAAWLPGTEGGGVADLLLRAADDGVAYDFTGRLPFSWPASACQTPLNAGDGQRPLFGLGYGLSYQRQGAALGRLDEGATSGGCEARSEMPIFARTAQAPYELLAASPDKRWPTTKIGDDLNATMEFPPGKPALLVSTVQLNTQQDAKLLRWQGPARVLAWSAQKAALSAYPDAALQFDLQLQVAPASAVRLGMDDAHLDLRPLLRRMPIGTKRSVTIPLACFAAAGADLARVEMPFVLTADQPFAAAIAHIRVAAGAANDANALTCTELTPPPN
jgi:beta-glucosidase